MAIREPIAGNGVPQDRLVEDDDEREVSVAKRRKLDNSSGVPVLSESEITSEPVAGEQFEPPTTALDKKDAATKSGGDSPASAILYVPGAVLPKLSKYIEQVIEVRVAAKYLSARNKEVSTRQIWGTDIYTDDSDIVAICQHAGKVMLRPVANQRYAGVSAFLRVRPGQSHYKGSLRFKIQTRNWIPPYHKCSLELIRVSPIMHAENLDPRAPENQLKVPKSIAASGPTRRPYTKRRFSPDITFMFNFGNEPCLKYCLGLIADRGMDSALWTSTRLRKEVLYLNTDDAQFELARSGNNGQFDTYRWSRCPSSDSGAPKDVPLSASSADVLEENIDWEEIEWGISTVKIRSSGYSVTTIKFMPITP